MEFKNLIPWSRGKEGLEVRPDTDPFTMLQTRMNRLFDDVFADTPFTSSRGVWGDRLPSVDLTESAEAIEVEAELPGVSEEDVQVSLDGDVLTIRGEKRSETKTEKKDYHHVERAYGTFQRSFRLPAEVDQDKVEATFKKGVLTVRLPKTERALERVRKIEVKPGD